MTIYRLVGLRCQPATLQPAGCNTLYIEDDYDPSNISLLLDRQARLATLTRLGVSWNFHKNFQSSVTGSATVMLGGVKLECDNAKTEKPL